MKTLDPVIAAPDSTGALPSPVAWVTSLTPVYDLHLRRFVDGMMVALVRSDRTEAARRLALAGLMIHPEDERACQIFSVTSRAAGRFTAARAALERILDPARSERPADPVLHLEYVYVLLALGNRDDARAELEALAGISDPNHPVGIEARRMLAASP
jgi:hypothetical protein